MRPLIAVLVLSLATLVSAQDAQLAVQELFAGVEAPVAITHAGDTRLFITLQRGRVVIYNGSALLPDAFLDIRSLVSCCGEQGLLSIAFHPRYRENGFFFVNYTDRSGDTVIARYRVSATDPNRADPASATILLHIDQPFANHNGGQLQFGPDGYLYIGMGDGGSGGDPGNRAQNLTTLLGKMLRIDVDSGTPYAIPPSNPFRNTAGARPEIWSYGLRNPWRFTFDRETGDLWIGDVGQNQIEEIDFQPASSIGGENYGWRRMEGSRCFEPSTNCRDAAMVLPVLEYTHSQGCSVSGGYVYRGSRFPRLRGLFFYGDFCSGTLWAAARQSDGSWRVRYTINTPLSISSFGEDMNGELYAADLGGSVYRVVDALPSVTPQRRRAVGR